jgi:GNAT superfamily N-acetyltransferase
MTAMNSLSFTTQPHPEWDKKIASGLHQECEGLTGRPEEFKTRTFYAKIDDIFVGGIISEQHGEILWIDSIWVEPKFRKYGIGSQLLEKAFLFAIQNKAKEMQLNTYFQEAHSFFLACSFEDVVSVPNWKYGLTCYLMRKALCPPKG